MGKFTEMTESLYSYFQEIGVREDDVLKACRAETQHLENRNMQISPEQGQLLTVLASLVSTKRGSNISAIEVGTFTGYSGICIARGLVPGQKLLTCDVNPDTLRIADKFFLQAGLDQTIDVAEGLASVTLDAFKQKGEADIDLMFIDADKSNYDTYYELGMAIVREGGLLVIDNVFWDGDVADPKVDDEDTRAIRALNAKIADDSRVVAATIPIADGVTICRKL